MYNQMERELKCLISKEQYDQIIKSYDFSKSWIQINTYYDTTSKQVKKQNAAVRIRTIDSKKIFTLKIRKDKLTHFEYEKEISTDKIDNINDPEVLSWLQKLNLSEPLKKTVVIQTERRIYRTEEAELCADYNIFNDIHDYEIEYEYLKEHDGIKTFNEILHPFHMKYEKNCPSKIARAFDYILCSKR